MSHRTTRSSPEGGHPLSISIGSGTPLPSGPLAAPGRTPDPEAQQAQVNAQADLLQALRGVDLPVKMVAARLSDNQGVDLYL